tara:strand:- start:733 stop:1770 length:1038 start_codon:yes stop_codon:yes gene_type:complete
MGLGSAAMNETARKMVAPGKGILAADESSGTIKKRFDTIGVESTEESRAFYRGLLFSADGAEDTIGGVIMFDETLRQSDADGIPFVQVLSDKGIVPGIKVDKGAKQIAGSSDETVTEGLDGLRERLAEYFKIGARFAKWRSVIQIGNEIPTWNGIKSDAHALARYAALCQEAGIVPIVEPEVLMNGNHNIERCYEVTRLTLQTTFDELFDAGVAFDSMVLKPNMVISGLDAESQASPEQIAEMSVSCFNEVVPASVPGIAFLSGGQTELEATANLNAMNAMEQEHPWELSFSYGRALQQSALAAWRGNPANRDAAQQAFLHRARMNGLARSGLWNPECENDSRLR